MLHGMRLKIRGRADRGAEDVCMCVVRLLSRAPRHFLRRGPPMQIIPTVIHSSRRIVYHGLPNPGREPKTPSLLFFFTIINSRAFLSPARSLVGESPPVPPANSAREADADPPLLRPFHPRSAPFPRRNSRALGIPPRQRDGFAFLAALRTSVLECLSKYEAGGLRTGLL